MVNWAAIIIISVAILITLGLVATVVIISNQIPTPKNQTNFDKSPKISLFLKATDMDTHNQVPASYSIVVDNETINSGHLIGKDPITNNDIPTEIKDIPADKTLKIYCWNEDHYVVKAVKSFSQIDIDNNKSTFSCDMPKIGKISVTSTGDLSNSLNLIKLNISTDAWLYHLEICEAHSSGIITAYPENKLSICPVGNWVNYSSYNASDKNPYVSLPDKQYRCSEEGSKDYMIANCNQVEGNRCEPISTVIPDRFKNKIDNCYTFSKNLFNETYEVIFDVKIENPNSLDNLQLVIIDFDRRPDPNSGEWTWFTEVQGNETIGAEDVTYTINYK